MKYPCLDLDPAIYAWNARASGEDPSFDKLSIYASGSGDDELTDLEIEDFRRDFENIVCPFMEKYPDALPKSQGGKFDALIVECVYRFFSEILPVEALSDLAFWRWLSIVSSRGYFWEFLLWRFPNKVQINWGIAPPADAREVYFLRAWLRGHLMYDPDLEDPLEYAKKGGGDVWRSHILRQEFGRDREFVKAFLDYLEAKKLSSDELRKKLIPALRAWTALGSFAHLTYQECATLIENLHNEGL
ncbi:hypothetical protein HFP89_08060 [Wenzhouxiangella sp. XN79A]|uniref:DUF6339 family protein n=1 Tax=Wenzhouxiangella sp. XN79A TaxID=2724193 RepID=UPI00144AF266|nr:DUF6339 family protein [Wenzhouxiangella sp. XN79A]NKI35118.1 hypothetical protein [Wenzhouxiangella sp. XN79A]